MSLEAECYDDERGQRRRAFENPPKDRKVSQQFGVTINFKGKVTRPQNMTSVVRYYPKYNKYI